MGVRNFFDSIQRLVPQRTGTTARVLTVDEIVDSFGSFWNLFNRLKRSRANPIALLGDGVSREQAARVFEDDRIYALSEIGLVSRELLLKKKGKKEIVFLFGETCSADQGLRVVRKVLTDPDLAGQVLNRRAFLHVWQVGRSYFRVLEKGKLDFVCPLAAI